MCSDNAITLKDLSKSYQIYSKPSHRLWQMLLRNRKKLYHEFQALKPLNLTIKKGEALGVVGRNGSGKSTLLQLICKTLTPSTGECDVKGRVSALLELGAGFNPEFTGKENVFLNAAILGLNQQEIQEKYDSIVSFSGIGDKVNEPVKTYSSGMYVRLAFAVAVATDPDILVIDEALSVGDELFQRKCFARIKQMQEQGTTLLFVSHGAGTIIEICDRAILLDQGEMLLDDDPKRIISNYHKLLFAPEEKRQEVREAIQKNKTVSQADKQTNTEASDTFNPDLVPESTVVHATRGARITEMHITTKRNKPINMLERRKTYQVRFTVAFDDPAHAVRFSFRLRSQTGVLLTGHNSVELDNKYDYIEAGKSYTAIFTFACNLLPGNYYVQIGCSGIVDGERVPLHRITDALVFKVIPEPGLLDIGMVDLLPKVEIKKAKA